VTEAVEKGEVNKTTVAYNLVLDEQNRKKQASQSMHIPTPAQNIKVESGPFATSIDSSNSGAGSLSGSLSGAFGGVASFVDRGDVTTNTHAEYTPLGESSIKLPKDPLPSWVIGIPMEKNASEAMSLVYDSLKKVGARWKRLGPYCLECFYEGKVVEGGLKDKADSQVKFRLQIYKNVSESSCMYVSDLVRVQGSLCAFMHVAGAFEDLVRVTSS